MVCIGHIFETGADLMDDAQLHLCFWKGSTNGFGEAREAVSGNQTIVHPSVLQVRGNLDNRQTAFITQANRVPLKFLSINLVG